MAARKTAMRTDGMLGVAAFRKWGTTTLNQIGIVTGDTPVKNWGGSRERLPDGAGQPRPPAQAHAQTIPLH